MESYFSAAFITFLIVQRSLNSHLFALQIQNSSKCLRLCNVCDHNRASNSFSLIFPQNLHQPSVVFHCSSKHQLGQANQFRKFVRGKLLVRKICSRPKILARMRSRSESDKAAETLFSPINLYCLENSFVGWYSSDAT